MLRKFTYTLIVCSLTVFSINNQSANAQQARDGAVLGGVAGAIIGGIAGHQNKETAGGIAIGGVAGALAGGLLGKSQEQQQAREYQYYQAQQAQRTYEVNRAVSLNDAVTMSRSGLSPSLIVSQIRNNGVQQEIGVQEVIALHDSGVSEVVIQEMQNARIAGTPQIRVQQRPTVIVQPAPVIYGGYYYHVPHNAYHGHGHHHW